MSYAMITGFGAAASDCDPNEGFEWDPVNRKCVPIQYGPCEDGWYWDETEEECVPEKQPEPYQPGAPLPVRKWGETCHPGMDVCSPGSSCVKEDENWYWCWPTGSSGEGAGSAIRGSASAALQQRNDGYSTTKAKTPSELWAGLTTAQKTVVLGAGALALYLVLV